MGCTLEEVALRAAVTADSVGEAPPRITSLDAARLTLQPREGQQRSAQSSPLTFECGSKKICDQAATLGCLIPKFRWWCDSVGHTMPVNVYLNQRLTDFDRRRKLFAGDIFILSSVKACAEICGHALETLRDVFNTPTPETAFRHLPVEEFVRRAEIVKNRFTNGPRSKQLLRDYGEETGANPEEYYFDVPRIRIVPDYEYLHSGVSYAYAAHRDTWYGGPQYQINHWMPVKAIDPDQTMAIYPAYFHKPIKNSSKDFDLDRWVNAERSKAVKNIEKEERIHPLPLEAIDPGSEIRFGGNAGDIMIFSGAHLHATVPNRSGITRFSVDFRFFHIDDIYANGVGKLTAPTNLDCEAARRDYGLGSLFHLGDFSPFKHGNRRND